MIESRTGPHTGARPAEGLMAMSECVCKTWASDDVALDVVLGHHHNCDQGPNAVWVLRNLVKELLTGMDVWARDCDGIHPAVWMAYKKARVLGGDLSVCGMPEERGVVAAIDGRDGAPEASAATTPGGAPCRLEPGAPHTSNTVIA